jgi:hypothetical protein
MTSALDMPKPKWDVLRALKISDGPSRKIVRFQFWSHPKIFIGSGSTQKIIAVPVPLLKIFRFKH